MHSTTTHTILQIPYLGIRELLPDGTRGQYKWQTYTEAADARSALGSGLLYHGIAPGSTVGLYSVNRPEWCLIDAACHAYSLVTVPLYDTLGPDSVEFICNHAELAAVCCSVECLPTLAKCLDKCPTVKLVVRPVPHIARYAAAMLSAGGVWPAQHPVAPCRAASQPHSPGGHL